MSEKGLEKEEELIVHTPNKDMIFFSTIVLQIEFNFATHQTNKLLILHLQLCSI